MANKKKTAEMAAEKETSAASIAALQENWKPIKSRISFMVLVSCENANPNGDPLNENRPRQSYDGLGIMTPECVKRKIRNRMQDLGYRIFVQSDSRIDDGFTNLRDRVLNSVGDITDKDMIRTMTCNEFLDVRSFGSVFAYKANKKEDKDDAEGVSVGVRGPVSIMQAETVDPIDPVSFQITKSTNGSEAKNGGMSSDRMGMRHVVPYGLYVIKGSISPQLAEKTGFSYQDAMVLKECLRTMFINDESSARPAGSMGVETMYWWEQEADTEVVSPAKIFRSVHITNKSGKLIPGSFEDYEVTVDPKFSVQPEVIYGL